MWILSLCLLVQSVHTLGGACQSCGSGGACCSAGQLCPGQILCCDCGQDSCACPSSPPSPSPPAPSPPTPAQPNPPNWPSSVTVFSPNDPNIQQVIDAAFAQNGGNSPPDNGQWSTARYAFLFKPGRYSQDVPVGYYTTILGLGESPEDVVFTSSKAVYSEEGNPWFPIGALNSFWRAAENFQTLASFEWWDGTSGMLWAVSQASPLRRVQVANNLILFEYLSGDPAAGFASGGFMANVEVSGIVDSGSQQQWMTRNSKVSQWAGGVWNMVFVGCTGAPSTHCGGVGDFAPITTVDSAPLIAEKPFITIDDSGKYYLQIPGVKTQSSGVEFSLDNTKTVDFQSVYVAQASDSASVINARLAAGLHVVFSPGIYYFTEPIKVTNNNTVLLGIGMATLVANGGSPVIVVTAKEGVRIAGILLQAGNISTPTLLQWGTSKSAGNPSNPGILHDVFARVGGPDLFPVQADVMVQINTGNVIIDNMWLWRADHANGGVLVNNSANPCINALQINGDDVIVYGLSAEHALADLLVWNGERGKVYFYQAEYPYDVTQANYGDKGFAGYKVASNVNDHDAYGIGVYHFFRDYNVTVKTGISVPQQLESRIYNPCAVFLNGSGVMLHILNDLGDTTSSTQPISDPGAHPAWYCAQSGL